MSDFAVKTTVRNARVLRAMKDANITTFAELARRSGVRAQEISNIVCFRGNVVSYGDWNDAAMSISAALHVEPEELWPEHMRLLKASKRHIEVELDSEEVAALAAETQKPIDRRALTNLLENLSPRERTVIEARYGLAELGEYAGEYTFEQVGKAFGVSRERIRQIEAKAMRKLREKIRKKRIELRPE